MPDITMCSGEGCSKKETCYRFKATPDEYRQSYFVNPPIEDGKPCQYYWPLEHQKIKVLDKANST